MTLFSKLFATCVGSPTCSIQRRFVSALAFCIVGVAATSQAQRPDGPPGGPRPGFGGPGGFNPFGGDMELVEKFDKDGDGRLNAEERQAAREFVKQERSGRRGFGGPGGPPFGRGGESTPPQPGEKISPEEVKNFPDQDIFDPTTLRTWFLEFESDDWEAEMADFNNTDVEMPAKLTIDGKTYEDVGVHFRGLSSFGMVGEGRKRSLNVTLDWVHKGQDIDSYNTFNLLNSHEDASFLRAVLYYQVARAYIPAPKANFVRVVINGENWGIYVNAQQFDKDFVKDWFGTKKGQRWRAPGRPGGQAGLAYFGDDVEAYKQVFSIKGKDDPEEWEALVEMIRTLNQTPADQLVEKLSPLLDIDGALKFLAIDIGLINNDGYWIRASDYSLYRDVEGRFHILPHDANETFAIPGGPGFGGGPGGPRGFGPGRGGPGGPGGPGGFQPPPEVLERFDKNGDGELDDAERQAMFEEFRSQFGRGGPGPGRGGPGGPRRGPGGDGPGRPAVDGVKLDPLYLVDDADKALASKLLAVPELRERYLGYVRDLAENWLDWEKLGPIAQQYHDLIADDVRRDTRKLESTEHFEKSLTEDVEGEGFGPGPRVHIGLKNFADQRREYLLNHPAIKALENQ